MRTRPGSRNTLRQLSAFPVPLISVDPANLGTADAALFGSADNGIEYCVKTVEKTPRVPGAELICYSLAESCGLAVPQFDVVELPGGPLAFGSVWDGSAAVQQVAIMVLLGQSKGKEIARTLSRIYAFDLFVHNTDRHLNNYLCVGGRLPGYAIRAYDFSRAWTSNGWPLPALPMQANEKTVRTYRHLQSIHPFDLAEANAILGKLRDFPVDAFKRLVDTVPMEWIDAKLRKKIVKWWAEERSIRIGKIIGGLKDGSFL
jgi:hypothetical protein